MCSEMRLAISRNPLTKIDAYVSNAGLGLLRVITEPDPRMTCSDPRRTFSE
jgi:hypothetical protein